VEPNASTGFTATPLVTGAAIPTTLKAWRYSYNLAGDLVATTDARGCGVNFHYDRAGRIRAEDFSPCTSEHFSVSTPPTVSQTAQYAGLNTEAFYVYDSVPPLIAGGVQPPPSQAGTPAAWRKGKLVAVFSRGSGEWLQHDGRGRVVRHSKKLVTGTGVTNQSVYLHQRYATRWHERVFTYDGADREVSATTGATTTELLGIGGTSTVTTTYTKRGTVQQVGGSYGTLVDSVKRDADGLVTEVVYGDIAETTATNVYDERRRLSQAMTDRARPGAWTATPSPIDPAPNPNGPPSTFQMVLRNDTYVYDVVGNPIAIADARTPSEWPPGAKPVQRTMMYDDLYRLSGMFYTYSDSVDTWTSPHDAENRVAANPGGNPTLVDSRRAKPSPHVSFVNRMQWQVFGYDWLGNTTESADDANGFYDRSLGPIVNDAAKPYQLKSANNATYGGTRTGSVDTVYDAAGHLTRLNVKRNGPCLPTGALCGQRYYYAWDEVGRLMLARRWDMASATMPVVTAGFPTNASAAATLRFAYDANDDRTAKQATDTAGNSSYTVYAHPTLELRRTTSADPDGAGPLISQYDVNAMTEVPYLLAHGVRLGRVVWEPAAKNVPEYAADGFPNPPAGKLHVFFELGDHLGSTSLAVDKSTSELVEQSTYLAYGQTESDYRPDRWGAFREDYRFTGKEEDTEAGIVYFGKRYLNAQLGRWMSFDPLTMHGLGADLNGYAYVSGKVLQSIDPIGLCGTPGAGGASQECNEGTDTQPAETGAGLAEKKAKQDSVRPFLRALKAASDAAGRKADELSSELEARQRAGVTVSDSDRYAVELAREEDTAARRAYLDALRPTQALERSVVDPIDAVGGGGPAARGGTTIVKAVARGTGRVARAVAKKLVSVITGRGKTVVAHAAGGVARAGGGGSTTLFRAVSEAEYQQLMQTGRFAAGPNSLGGKFFAESAADAARWGDALQGAGNYRIISAELPTSAADQLMRWTRLDGIGPARYGELEQLTGAIIRSVP
jgi:RHS repeat-associated protein